MEILVRTNPHPSPLVDEGDVVDIREDGWAWGAGERKAAWLADGRAEEDWPRNHYVIIVPDLTVTEAVEGYRLLDPQLAYYPADDDVTVVKQRRWYADLSLIPEALDAAIAEAGEWTLPFAEARQFVFDKVTGEPL